MYFALFIGIVACGGFALAAGVAKVAEVLTDWAVALVEDDLG